MLSPSRAFRRHGGRRVAKTALTIGLLTTMASASLMMGGLAPAGADHDPLAPAEIHITKVALNSTAPGNFISDIPGFPATIADGATASFDVAPGISYFVAEFPETPTHIFCNTTVNVTIASPNVIIVPGPGQVVACVFTNRNSQTPVLSSEVNITKIVEDDPADTVPFTVTLTTAEVPADRSGDIAHGQTLTIGPAETPPGAPQGPYSLHETLAPNHTFVSLTCDGLVTPFLIDPTTGLPFPFPQEDIATTSATSLPAAVREPNENIDFVNCILLNRFVAPTEPEPPVLSTLTIDKVQVGGPALTQFTIDVDCFDIDRVVTIDDDDAPVVITGIPVDTICNVTERPAANFRPEYNPVGPVIIDADGETVTITNVFEDPGPGPDPGPDPGDDDDGYNQYPGDGDFDFDTPFNNDDDDPAPAEVAANNDTNQTGTGGQTSADPVVGASGDVTPAPAGDVAPLAIAELPRTGTTFTQLGLMAGLLMVMLGLAALLGARRRQAPQA